MAALSNLSDFDMVTFQNTLMKYTKENVAVMTAYIREPFATSIYIDEVCKLFL